MGSQVRESDADVATPLDGGRLPAVDLNRGHSRIDIRVVLVSLLDQRLSVALEPDESGTFRLPGEAARRSEPLDSDARRVVRKRIGLREHYLEQLYTISIVEDGQWVIVVAYLGLTWYKRQHEAQPTEQWFDVRSLPRLVEADQLLLEYGLTRLRAKLGYTSIAFHLLPPAFTLPELQATYETILGRRLDKRNFRRRVIAAGFLEATGERRRDGSHRPAAVYRFRAAHDPGQYLTPDWANET
jgi:8-oxo-dGTP diphosphatase